MALNHAIDSLDNRIANALQTRLYLELQSLLRRATQWFLRNSELHSGLNDIVSRYRQGIDQLHASLSEYLPQSAVDALNRRAEDLKTAGLPEELAHRIAGLGYLQRAPDIVQVATESGSTLEAAARVLYASGAKFDMDGLIRRAEGLTAKDFFERLAINRTIDQVFLAHRAITRQALDLYGTSHDPWSAWVQTHGERVNLVLSTIRALLSEKDFDLAKLSVAQGLLSDLATARA
jgi:glutamate dehydrogenase